MKRKIDNINLILELINKGLTIREISNITDFSYQEIYRCIVFLRQKGFIFAFKNYSNGDIKYEIVKGMYSDERNRIITEHSENELQLMLVSDLHFGSKYEDVRLLHIIYDYCIQNGIHYLLNLGDLIEGHTPNMKIPVDKQIDHALRVHPFSNEILVFLLLGNHDYSLLTGFGIDVKKAIENTRGDILPLGYGEKILCIKNDQIIMQHNLLVPEFHKSICDKTIILRGHRHASQVLKDSSNLIIYLPSLSKLNFNKSSFPGAVRLCLKFRAGMIEYAILEELVIINKKLYTVNESTIFVGLNKSFKEKDKIENEEDYTLVKKKV